MTSTPVTNDDNGKGRVNAEIYLFVWVFFVPQKNFSFMEMSPLPVKDCKF